MMNVQKLAEVIEESHYIVALTGAGISTAAGIPDFRGPKGIYVTRQYDPEKTFDIDWFDRDPHYFFEFAKDFLGTVEHIQPTVAHMFLTTLEREGKLRAIATQNIDGLHQKAGSRNVLEIHGSFQHGHCRKCGRTYRYEELKSKILSEAIPHCATCGGVIKPDIVFYGEAVQDLDQAESYARQADLFLVLGSSLSVYPAALLPQFSHGPVVCVNQGPMGGLIRDMKHIDQDIDQVCAGVRSILYPASTH